MIIDTKNTHFYYLTLPSKNNNRRDHLLSAFKEYLLTEIHPCPASRFSKKLRFKQRKQKSGGTGFLRILDKAVQDQESGQPFKPFGIFEDDVTIYRPFPDQLEIPDDCDILYIGLSSWGMTNKPTGRNNTVCCSSTTGYDHIVRVYNMLSTHGMMICSLRGLLMFQKCILQDFHLARGYDISIARTQPYLKVYALKTPLVYQKKELGGEEGATKITHRKFMEKSLPRAWKHPRPFSL